MQYQEFQRLAIASILGNQEDNGSWLSDDATTCAALAVLLEDMFGPLAFWRHSWIYSYVHGHRIKSWPLMFSYGVHTGHKGVDRQKLAAVFNGMKFGAKGSKNCNLWQSIKWGHLFAFIDFDARPHLYAMEEEVPNKITSYEPWLVAQLAKYFLFADRAYITLEDQLERCRMLIPSIEHLALSVEADHWVSKTIGPVETTAIVAQFLFHPGVFAFLEFLHEKPQKAERLHSLKTDVLSWLRKSQREDGSWESSPAITAHCVDALMTPLENTADREILSDLDKTVIARAIKWLLSDSVLAWWEELQSYEQIGVLLLLKRLSSLRLFSSTFDGLQVSSHRVKRDVFISYAGCDGEFAHRLASDLEARGIRVWFAEWDIDYGDDIVQEIENGLDETTKFLIVLSPEAVDRKWVRQELSTAFHKALSGAETVIIPIMLKRCTPPAFVRTKKWADFTVHDSYDTNLLDLARRLKQRKIKRK